MTVKVNAAIEGDYLDTIVSATTEGNFSDISCGILDTVKSGIFILYKRGESGDQM